MCEWEHEYTLLFMQKFTVRFIHSSSNFKHSDTMRAYRKTYYVRNKILFGRHSYGFWHKFRLRHCDMDTLCNFFFLLLVLISTGLYLKQLDWGFVSAIHLMMMVIQHIYTWNSVTNTCVQRATERQQQ